MRSIVTVAKSRFSKSFFSNGLVTILFLCMVAFSASLTLGHGHGILTDPRQRGALRLDNHMVPIIDMNAPQDYSAHFPAGSKNLAPGSGTASVKRAAGYNWTPYKPLDSSFHWRAGVCGDELGAAQDHLRGGEFYYDAKRVREYVQGSIIFMESEIVAHHNGYYEFYICNIDTCGDDISPRCFHEGHCRRLLRTPGPCDSGYEHGCGPIDPWNPGRWYVPCRTSEPMLVGGWSRSLAYTLPPDLACDHCVIQWYWTAANTCNPPGVRDYFTSPYAPKWPDCPGQGGAIGGWTSNKGTCGGEEFAEEYWQCADVRIVPNRASTPQPVVTPPPETSASGSGSFVSLGSGSFSSVGLGPSSQFDGRSVPGLESRFEEDSQAMPDGENEASDAEVDQTDSSNSTEVVDNVEAESEGEEPQAESGNVSSTDIPNSSEGEPGIDSGLDTDGSQGTVSDDITTGEETDGTSTQFEEQKGGESKEQSVVDIAVEQGDEDSNNEQLPAGKDTPLAGNEAPLAEKFDASSALGLGRFQIRSRTHGGRLKF